MPKDRKPIETERLEAPDIVFLVITAALLGIAFGSLIRALMDAVS